MPVSAVGASTPWLPVGPPAGRGGSGPAASGSAGSLNAVTQATSGQAQSAAALAIQQSEELQHGGGGGGGGHAHKAGLKAIEDVATRAGLKIEVREKTPAERQAEIERLKLLAGLRAGQVNAKQDGEGRGGRQQQPQDGRQPGQGREQPAAG